MSIFIGGHTDPAFNQRLAKRQNIKPGEPLDTLIERTRTNLERSFFKEELRLLAMRFIAAMVVVSLALLVVINSSKATVQKIHSLWLEHQAGDQMKQNEAELARATATRDALKAQLAPLEEEEKRVATIVRRMRL